jgi:uncharacterized protein (TIGR02996 family)
MTGIDATGAALLADILEYPEDDTPRLIYADWLDEHGEADRAEFIRVQCGLAGFVAPATGVVTCEGKGPPTRAGSRKRCKCRPCALWRRQRSLLAGPRPDVYENEVVWFNAGDGTDAWRTTFRPRWRRGFVEAVVCRAADWLAHAAALLARHPIREVTLTTLPTWQMLALLLGHEEPIIGVPRWFGVLLPQALATLWPRVVFTLPAA